MVLAKCFHFPRRRVCVCVLPEVVCSLHSLKSFLQCQSLNEPTWISYLTTVHHKDPAPNITPVRHIQTEYTASDGDSVKDAFQSTLVVLEQYFLKPIRL